MGSARVEQMKRPTARSPVAGAQSVNRWPQAVDLALGRPANRSELIRRIAQKT